MREEVVRVVWSDEERGVYQIRDSRGVVVYETEFPEEVGEFVEDVINDFAMGDNHDGS